MPKKQQKNLKGRNLVVQVGLLEGNESQSGKVLQAKTHEGPVSTVLYSKLFEQVRYYFCAKNHCSLFNQFKD